jgi:beta-glucosidase
MAEALVDVMLGVAEPGGRLPTTIPVRIQDNPSWGNFPAEGGRIVYGEGVLVGYRWYEARHLPVRYPFGRGGSYTTFRVDPPETSAPTLVAGERLTVWVAVTNTGHRRGAEVVQCYVAPPPGSPAVRPPKELAAFGKVWLDAGESAVVDLVLDERAFARWDPGRPDHDDIAARAAAVPMADRQGRPPRGWVVDAGRHELHVGTSSEDIAHVVPVEVDETIRVATP